MRSLTAAARATLRQHASHSPVPRLCVRSPIRPRRSPPYPMTWSTRPKLVTSPPTIRAASFTSRARKSICRIPSIHTTIRFTPPHGRISSSSLSSTSSCARVRRGCISTARCAVTALKSAWSAACISTTTSAMSSRSMKRRPRTRRTIARHTLAVNAHDEPVFLAYRDQPAIDKLVRAETNDRPLFHFNAPDGVTHTVWPVDNAAPYVEAFAKLDCATLPMDITAAPARGAPESNVALRIRSTRAMRNTTGFSRCCFRPVSSRSSPTTVWCSI